ncbi:MAG: hypothetical protein JWO71_623, partial [Candidatus Acidoferrum typicum]|nr:hypothetical protein [Candidatus Acidoferrum typicum]
MQHEWVCLTCVMDSEILGSDHGAELMGGVVPACFFER